MEQLPDMLCFYSKSRDVPPGQGANERVRDVVNDYANLQAQPSMHHWRRVLSNFDVAPFSFRGHRYNTIEHAFQGAKTALKDAEKALHFTLDSGHVIGIGDGAMAQRHRKYVLLDAVEQRTWAGLSDGVMREAAEAKYAEPTNAHARAVLVATGEAQLWHISRGHPLARFGHLERIRQQLNLK